MKYKAKTIIYDENGNEVLKVEHGIESVRTETNYIGWNDSSTTTYIELCQTQEQIEIDLGVLYPKKTLVVFK